MRVPALVGIERVATTGPGRAGAKVTRRAMVDPAGRVVPGRGWLTLNAVPAVGALPEGGMTVGPAVLPRGTVVEGEGVVVGGAAPLLVELPTPSYPLTVTGPVTVRGRVVDAPTGRVRLDPTGTDPKSTAAACTGAADEVPKASSRPPRVPTKIRPFHAVGVANFGAIPIGADQSSGSTPLVGMAP